MLAKCSICFDFVRSKRYFDGYSSITCPKLAQSARAGCKYRQLVPDGLNYLELCHGDAAIKLFDLLDTNIRVSSDKENGVRVNTVLDLFRAPGK